MNNLMNINFIVHYLKIKYILYILYSSLYSIIYDYIITYHIRILYCIIMGLVI